MQVALLTSATGLQSADFVMHTRGGQVRRLDFGNSAMDPTYFVLLFPYGEQGWTTGLHHAPLYTTVADVLASTNVQSINPCGDTSRRHVTAAQFYAHRLQTRSGPNHEGGRCLLMGARLLQEYCCTAYARVEAQRLEWQRHNQALLCCDTLGNLRAARSEAARANRPMPRCGRGVRLASSFVGGPRDTHNRFLDGMAVVADTGRPSLLITMTCNPQWPEIRDSLPFGIKAENRPELTARVFKAKLEELLNDLVVKHVLGTVVAIMSVVEFQYRGLPHAHILVTLQSEDRILTADDIDQIVCTQLPGRDCPDLRAKVLQHMIHNDCQTAPAQCMCCQRNGRCRWRFPHTFRDVTAWSEQELYPKYARPREPAHWEHTASGRIITNEWVASYNADLLSKYDCHLNVEVCASLEAVRYLYKYIYKGPDRANVRVVHADTGDEVSMYQDMRYFGACESVWRLLGFALYYTRPSVERLPLHLDGEMNVIFRPGTEARAADRTPVSKLLDWLQFCRAPNQTYLPAHWRTLTYCQFPGYFTHHRQRGWRGRANRERFKAVGRLPPATLANEEVFFLRRWLCHTTCGDVHDHLMAAHPMGTLVVPCVADLMMGYLSFKALCIEKGLADDDGEWRWAMDAAGEYATSRNMRSLFVEIVTFNQPSDAMGIFNDYWDRCYEERDLGTYAAEIDRLVGIVDRTLMSDDQRRQQTQLQRAVALKLMRDELRAEGCADWRTQLPMTDEEIASVAVLEARQLEPLVIRVATDFNAESEAQEYRRMRAEISTQPSQLRVLEVVETALQAGEGALIFLSAYAGCGKTFIEKAILAYTRSQGLIALAVASTGIAALLLPGGTTLHSRFKVPLNADQDSMLNILAQSADAELIRRTTLLVWDEAVMNNKHILHAMDRTLRLLRSDDRPFGGMIVVMSGVLLICCLVHSVGSSMRGCVSGDFRQTLPIDERASRAQIVDSLHHRSPLWSSMQVFELEENMRAVTLLDEAVDDAERESIRAWGVWLRDLGDGRLVDANGMVRLRDDQVRCVSTAMHIHQMLNDVYPRIAALDELEYWAARAIVAARHSTVDALNRLMLDRLTEEEVICYSTDMQDNDNHATVLPEEYLNREKPVGMPAHDLRLKKGAVVILLRNLRRSEGLVNGTRLIIEEFIRRGRVVRMLVCRILTGERRGARVIIPRILLRPPAGKYPASWARRQFPVKLAFAMYVKPLYSRACIYASAD